MDTRTIGVRALLTSASTVALGAFFVLDGIAADMVWNLNIAVLLGLAAWGTRGLERHRGAWRWIIAGYVCFLVGDATYAALEYVSGRDPYPSVADLAYVLGYPLIAVGLMAMGRTAGRERHLGAWIDASIVALGASALMWSLVMAPTLGDDSSAVLDRVVSLFYASGDLVLIAALAVAFGRQLAPGRSSALLMSSLVAMLVADVVYAMVQLDDAYSLGDPVDALWWASYLLLMLAVLDRTSADVGAAADDRDTRLTRLRSLTLVGAAVVAPMVLLVEYQIGVSGNPVVLLSATIAIFVLVVVRLQLVAGELEHKRRELEFEATHDGLTGLVNRNHFTAAVAAAIADEHRRAVVLYLDLDDFKVVNDVHGHPVGDALLVEVAARLRGVTSDPDHVARLGGDEFAILLIDDQAKQASLLAEELLSSIRKPVTLANTVVYPATSIGIASITDDHDVAELMRQADVAMYTAKRAGKDRWRNFAPEVGDGAKTWLELRADLPFAVDRGELTLEYQPVVTIDDGRIVAFEALVRWNHPVHGRVAPDRFIPIAEESRLIDEIGHWVLTEATMTLAGASGTFDGVDVSVNISPRQLERWAFIDDVRRALETSGLASHRLVIEVTESASIDQVEQVGAVLSAVRSLGVRVALDDLGAGFASLRHLGSLPIDIVKLDRSFMRRPMQERDLLPGLIDLIRALDLVPVVEGVETRAHHDLTRQLGVKLAQGFRYGAPMPFEAARELVEAQRSPTVDVAMS